MATKDVLLPVLSAAHGKLLLERRCTRNFDPMCFSLREGDGVHRLTCLAFSRREDRRATAADAEHFLHTIQERFVYQLFASRRALPGGASAALPR